MTGPSPAAGPSYRRSVALLAAGAYFMELLDSTIIATAAPSMGASLHTDASAIGVAITAYVVVGAVLIPASGWAVGRVGIRPLFLAAIAVFTLGSGLCAVSTSLPELVAFRVLQGAGGAMTVPIARLTVLRGTSRSDLVRAMAFLTWPALMAPVVAPLLGGVLTTYASWRWIFVLNLPIGAAAMVAAAVLLDGDRDPTVCRLDVTGLLLTGSGLGLLVFASAPLSEAGGDVVLGIVAAGCGLVVTAVAVCYLLRSRNPLLRLRVFAVDSFRVSHAGGSVFRATVTAVPFLLPLMFEGAFGWSAARAGSMTLFVFVGNLAAKPTTGPLLRAWGYRRVMLGSGSVVAVTMVLMGLLGRHTPTAALVVLLVVSGGARSIGFTCYNTLGFADVAPDDIAAANTVSSTVQQVATGLGVAVSALLLRAFAAGNHDLELPYRYAFFVIAALTLLPVVEAVLLRRGAGDDIRPVSRRSPVTP